MRKATKETKGNAKQGVKRETGVQYKSIAEIIRTAEKPADGKGATRYTLADGVVLGIVFTDRDYDFGFVDFFGLNANVTIRAGKSGMFLSFPSVKNKNGEYVDMVRVYDTNFHACVKDLLAEVYAEE